MWMCLSCNHLFLFIKQGFVKLNELKAVLSMLWESVLHSPSYDKTQSFKKKIFTTSALIKPSAWHLKDPELHPTMCFSCVYEAPDLRRGHRQRWKRWCKKKKPTVTRVFSPPLNPFVGYSQSSQSDVDTHWSPLLNECSTKPQAVRNKVKIFNPDSSLLFFVMWQ